jgi:hypothetical protein
MSLLASMGRWLVVGGLVIAMLGGVLWLAARLFPNLSQFPGTVRVQSGGLTCVIPILASIIFSIILSLLLNLVARFFNK